MRVLGLLLRTLLIGVLSVIVTYVLMAVLFVVGFIFLPSSWLFPGPANETELWERCFRSPKPADVKVVTYKFNPGREWMAWIILEADLKAMEELAVSENFRGGENVSGQSKELEVFRAFWPKDPDFPNPDFEADYLHYSNSVEMDRKGVSGDIIYDPSSHRAFIFFLRW